LQKKGSGLYLRMFAAAHQCCELQPAQEYCKPPSHLKSDD
jgi:hypothetical protein